MKYEWWATKLWKVPKSVIRATKILDAQYSLRTGKKAGRDLLVWSRAREGTPNRKLEDTSDSDRQNPNISNGLNCFINVSPVAKCYKCKFIRKFGKRQREMYYLFNMKEKAQRQERNTTTLWKLKRHFSSLFPSFSSSFSFLSCSFFFSFFLVFLFGSKTTP